MWTIWAFLCVHAGASAVEKLVGLTVNPDPVPAVIWHGVNDDFNGDKGIGAYLEDQIPGIYVHRICVGNHIDDVTRCTSKVDEKNSLLSNANYQAEYVCKLLSEDDKLSRGFNMFGISQGALLSRAVIQRCGTITVKNFISFGGPHKGVNGILGCPPDSPYPVCDYGRRLANHLVYRSGIQETLMPVQYWCDPLHYTEYLENSLFLPYLNQEFGVNSTEVERLTSLENMVLVKFNQDKIVIPRDSEWFGFYQTGSADIILPAEKQPEWETLGLKYLYDRGSLHFLAKDGDHVRFTFDWFEYNLLPFFQNTFE